MILQVPSSCLYGLQPVYALPKKGLLRPDEDIPKAIVLSQGA